MTRSLSNGNRVCQTFIENKLQEATSILLHTVEVNSHYGQTVDCISQLNRDATVNVPLTKEKEVMVTCVNDSGDFYVVRVCDQEKRQDIHKQIKDQAHTYKIAEAIEPIQDVEEVPAVEQAGAEDIERVVTGIGTAATIQTFASSVGKEDIF